MSEDWKSSNARGYITFRFGLKELRESLNKIKGIDKYDIRKNTKLYKALLEVLGQCLMPYVPYETGKLARFYTDSKNGLMYRRFNDKDGFNVAEYQYNVTELPGKLTSPKHLDHFNTQGYTYYYKKGQTATYSRTGYVYPRNMKVHVKGKNAIVHDKASDHWADERHQAKIWPRFTQRAKPLIVKAIREELRGKK